MAASIQSLAGRAHGVLPLVLVTLASSAFAAGPNAADREAGSRPSQSVTTEPVEIRVGELAPDGRFCWLPRWRAPAAPKWSLALGGGGSWGIAHLGVLEAMEEDGLVPDAIVGTSAGALMGGFYASGISPRDVAAALHATDWNELFTRTPRLAGESQIDDPFDESALFTVVRLHSGAYEANRGVVPDRLLNLELSRYLAWAGATAQNDLDHLPIPFRAVATDLNSGTPYAPRYASLPRIVRASIGLPIFTPVVVDDHLLADGGILENLPTRAAREMGDVVIAVQLTREGKSLSDPPRVWTINRLMSRIYDISAASQRRAAVENADVLLNVAVGNISFLDFHGHVDELIAAGRSAWRANRDAFFAALEAKTRDGRWFDLRAIEAADAGAEAAARDMEIRLGMRPAGAGTIPKRVSALRLQLELVRLLRSGSCVDAWIEVRSGGRAVVHVRPATPVRSLELDVPASLAGAFAGVRLDRIPAPVTAVAVMDAVGAALVRARRDGLFLAGVRDVQWDAAAGRMKVIAREGTLSTFELRTPGARSTEKDAPTGAAPIRAEVRTIGRKFFRFIESGGEMPGATSVDLSAKPDGSFGLTASANDRRAWEWALALGLSDQLGPSVWTRWTIPAGPQEKRWAIDARLAAWRLGVTGGFEVEPPGGITFARVIAARPAIPRYTPGGDLEGSTPFRSVAVGLGLRTPSTAVGEFELLTAWRWTDAASDVQLRRDANDRSSRRDLSVALQWNGDRRDDPRRPTLGAAWSVTAVQPIAGSDRPWVLSGDVSLHAPLLASRRASVGLLLRGATAGRDRSLPVDQWTDVGSWWEAPRMLPGRGLSPEVKRGTLVVRSNLATLGGFSISGGASAAAWSLGDTRIDPSLPASGHGFSVFADMYYGRFGPFTVGVAWGSLRGNAIYLLASPVRVPWPGPRLCLPGRCLQD